MKLNTRYLGLDLKNPVIVSSSKLTGNLDKIAELEEKGAAAVVLKSLFEEQILLDTQNMVDNVDTSYHAEAFNYFSQSAIGHFMDEYLSLVDEAGKKVSIPVIPSINCTTDGTWIEYARRFEKVGAKALELNIFIQPHDLRKTSAELEETYLSIIRKMKSAISIPFALKISTYFTGLANVMKKFSDEGAAGLVLFNRYYRADIDIDNLKVIGGSFISHPSEMLTSLQWIAILAGKINADLSATTGIHSYKDAVKLLLAGADTIQLCSTIYNNGTEQIPEILKGIEGWMRKHKFKSIEEFRGLMSEEKSTSNYKRAQFIKTLVGIE